MRANPLEGQKVLLLELLRSSYDGFSWHGPNLMQALRGVDLQQAAWRPASEPPVWNIHEVTLHVADVMQKCGAQLFGARVVRDVEGAFPLAAVSTQAEWIATLDFVQQSYVTLEHGLRAITVSALTDVSPSTAYGRRWTLRDHIQGVALHNTYHAAQIVSLRKRQGAWTELV
jgi:DinB superfamily